MQWTTHWKRFSSTRMRNREPSMKWNQCRCCQLLLSIQIEQRKKKTFDERTKGINIFFFSLLSFAISILNIRTFAFIADSLFLLLFIICFFHSGCVIFNEVSISLINFSRFDINLTPFCGCKTSSYCLLMSPLIFHSILAQSLPRVQWTQEKFIIFSSSRSPFLLMNLLRSFQFTAQRFLSS